ncbi:MAG: hypothetical protein ACRD99_05440 [Nitrososphaera sp.]
MAKKIGAVIALVFLFVIAFGVVLLSTPFGQKAMGFVDGMRSFKSPQDMTGCITGGCQMQWTGMSLFS